MRVEIDDVEPPRYADADERQSLALEDGENADEAVVRIEEAYGRNSITVKKSELRRALVAIGWVPDPV